MALNLNLGFSFLCDSGTLGTVSGVEWRLHDSCSFLSRNVVEGGVGGGDERLTHAKPWTEPEPSLWLILTALGGRCH